MFSNSERSPKRQRQSYSPASPAADTKTLSSAFVQPPQTPPPSVRMSPSWQSQQAQANGAASTSGSVTFPTPPSTAGFPSQAAALSVMGDTREGGEDHSRRQTPDHEGENEKKRKRDMEIGEDEGRTPYKRHHGEGEHKQQDELVDAGYRRTDHERHVGAEEDGDSKAQHEQGPAAPAPKIYKLCADPVLPSRLCASENVISLYSLTAIQASVARKDVAGNKINKLRKSYENKVKALGLEGRSKAQVGNAALEGLLDPVWDMQAGPEPDMNVWAQQRAAENPRLEDGAGGADELLGKLGAALSLAPGQLPKVEHEHWKGMLGLDEIKPMPVALQATKPGHHGDLAAAVAGMNPALARTAPNHAVRASAPASPHGGGNGLGAGARPDRAGKRRRYDESSYEGYDDEGGYSTGGIDDTARRGSVGKRQKRKDFATATSPSFNTPAGGSGGMVGVRSS